MFNAWYHSACRSVNLFWETFFSIFNETIMKILTKIVVKIMATNDVMQKNKLNIELKSAKIPYLIKFSRATRPLRIA